MADTELNNLKDHSHPCGIQLPTWVQKGLFYDIHEQIENENRPEHLLAC